MYEQEMRTYRTLNELAEPDGIVIFGGSDDLGLPLCELKQAFALEQGLYNRSLPGLSVKDAAVLYETCAVPLYPETVLLHLGATDTELFRENPDTFDRYYRELISCVRTQNKSCRIAVLSLKNPEETPVICEMNKHLKYIADSERCEFGDITAKRVWNPKETKDVVSFVYSIGFEQPLKTKRPLYDLAKMLYCWQ